MAKRKPNPKTHAKNIVKLLVERPVIKDVDGVYDMQGDMKLMEETVCKYIRRHILKSDD